jgi:hypothetical protein
VTYTESSFGKNKQEGFDADEKLWLHMFLVFAPLKIDENLKFIFPDVMVAKSNQIFLKLRTLDSSELTKKLKASFFSRSEGMPILNLQRFTNYLVEQAPNFGAERTLLRSASKT